MDYLSPLRPFRGLKKSKTTTVSTIPNATKYQIAEEADL